MTFHPEHMKAGIHAAMMSPKTPAHLKPHLEQRMKTMHKKAPAKGVGPAKKPAVKARQMSDMKSGFGQGPMGMTAVGDPIPAKKAAKGKASKLRPAFFGENC